MARALDCLICPRLNIECKLSEIFFFLMKISHLLLETALEVCFLVSLQKNLILSLNIFETLSWK